MYLQIGGGCKSLKTNVLIPISLETTKRTLSASSLKHHTSNEMQATSEQGGNTL